MIIENRRKKEALESLFAKTLCGHYSNKKQAQESPHIYAHINIYFRRLSFSLLNSISFYSEQSFDYSPWSPYRQAILRLIYNYEYFILENYSIKNSERIAGAGFHLNLLSEITRDNLVLRDGCEMHFREIDKGIYQGGIKPGEKCIIEKSNNQTYVVSYAKFGKNKWESIDEGFDTKTHEKVWGSENGPLKFNKILEI